MLKPPGAGAVLSVVRPCVRRLYVIWRRQAGFRTLARRFQIGNPPLAVSLSKRVQKVKPSPTLAVTARAAKLKAEGKDIIGLGAGEPDFDTPKHIADAGVEAIRTGVTRYTAVDGTAEL